MPPKRREPELTGGEGVQRKRIRQRGKNPPGFPAGMFHPELVGVRRNYPKTQEEWQRRSDHTRKTVAELRASGKWITRKGIPDGWARKRKELEAIRVVAQRQAKEDLKKMIENGEIAPFEDPRAEEALEFAMTTMRMQDPVTGQWGVTMRDRVACMKTILEYTKQKPVAKTETKLSSAEDWLRGIVTQN